MCGDPHVIPHHEDYADSHKIIWLCEQHHTDYHDRKIGLFNGRLRWDPMRLTRGGQFVTYPHKKYETLRSLHRTEETAPPTGRRGCERRRRSRE